MAIKRTALPDQFIRHISFYETGDQFLRKRKDLKCSLWSVKYYNGLWETTRVFSEIYLLHLENYTSNHLQEEDKQKKQKL